MAITAEEIGQIAEAVAQRVVTPKEACGCGLNAWSTAHLTERLMESLNSRDLSRIEADLSIFYNDLDDMARTCHVNLDATRDLLGKISEAATAGIWAQANTFLSDVVITIDSALRDAAAK